MVPQSVLFRMNALYYFFRACLKNGVSPLRFLSVHEHHYSEGYVSKHRLNSFIPEKNRLKTILLQSMWSPDEKVARIEKQFNFPVILKPEWGFSSHGIKRIDNKRELVTFLKTIKDSDVHYICQEFCKYEFEYDIFYVMVNNTYKILSLTRVEFPKVIGDGVHSVKELIEKSEIEHTSTLCKLNKKNLHTIPKKAEKYILTYTNSILQGTKYADEQELLKNNYFEFLEHIKEIKEFKINRISLKANSIADLVDGNFKIFEMNILFPAPINTLDTALSGKNKRKILKSTFNHIVRTVGAHTEKSSVVDNMKFYYNNKRYASKIKRLGKQC